MRVAFGGPYALDFGAWFITAQHRGADLEALAELLPELEHLIVFAWSSDRTDD